MSPRKIFSFDECRLAQASTPREWTIVRALRMKNFFKSNIDPYTWTFDHQDHIHFVFYKNQEIIGYVHIQLWPEKRALLRIIVIDEPYRNLGFGGQLLNLCESWLAHQGIQKLLVQSSPEAHPFYCHHGYVNMPIDNPYGHKTDTRDIEMGKTVAINYRMDKVNLKKKFQLFDAHWTPKILGEVNNCYVKIFKAKGEFVWHRHEHEDEFFLIVKGQLCIKLRDREIVLNEGEFFIVPKGVDHLPYANEEAHVLLFEPKEVINTGNATSDKKVANPDWI